jgi:predicted lipoprotein with Yx(FWY)xxD motif
MMSKYTALIAAALLYVAAGCASMDSPAGVQVADGVLTDKAGMTLYTFDKDPANAGKSVCNGGCARNWPPLMASSGATTGGDWSIVTRDDGTKQWAYAGKPLYRWIKDQKPGDKTGDGFRGVWHVARR